ncbi:TPA: hypothetical protein SLG40_003826 [Serratia odorifera]|nr:hypothetical protein [Serratia odorifera]
MYRLNLLCFIISFLKRLIDRFSRNARIRLKIFRLENDAIILRSLLAELGNLAQDIQKQGGIAGYEPMIQELVFWNAHSLGYRQYFRRINQWILQPSVRQVIAIGCSLDHEHWKRSWQSGQDEARHDASCLSFSDRYIFSPG